MKSKKIIVSIVVCLAIAIIAVFVVPSSSSYLSEVTVSGEKKKGYSFYKVASISSKLKDVDFIIICLMVYRSMMKVKHVMVHLLILL